MNITCHNALALIKAQHILVFFKTLLIMSKQDTTVDKYRYQKLYYLIPSPKYQRKIPADGSFVLKTCMYTFSSLKEVLNIEMFPTLYKTTILIMGNCQGSFNGEDEGPGNGRVCDFYPREKTSMEKSSKRLLGEG